MAVLLNTYIFQIKILNLQIFTFYPLFICSLNVSEINKVGQEHADSVNGQVHQDLKPLEKGT